MKMTISETAKLSGVSACTLHTHNLRKNSQMCEYEQPLWILAKHPGWIRRRRQIYNEVWPSEADQDF